MSLSIYMKPTNFCNIGCEHCYLPESTRAEKDYMSDEMIRRTARFALNLALKERHSDIHFIWHGGEPMVLSPEYYENASQILDSEIGPEYYTQSFQTSLIPYRKEWASLFRDRFQGCIGSSIDFTQRHVKSSTEDYRTLWLRKVQMAKDDGIFIIPGMVPTRNEAPYGSEIVDWFIENDFPMFNIDRYSQYGFSTEDWPSNKEHSDFMSGMLDRVIELMEKGDDVPFINVIASGIGGVLLGMPGDRWGTQCQKSFIVVEPDGSLNTCPDRANNEPSFGNIEDGASDFQKSKGRRKWIQVQNITHKKDHCRTCEFNTWCQSGCPITPNGPSDGESECAGYKTFLLKIKEYAEDPYYRDLLMQYLDTDFKPIVADKNVLDLAG